MPEKDDSAVQVDRDSGSRNKGSYVRRVCFSYFPNL